MFESGLGADSKADSKSYRKFLVKDMVRVSDDRLPVHVCPNYSSRTGQNVAQIYSADPNLTYDVESMFRQWTDEVGASERTAFRRDYRLSLVF